MFSKDIISQSIIDAVSNVLNLDEKIDTKKRTTDTLAGRVKIPPTSGDNEHTDYKVELNAEETDKGESSTDAKGNKTTKYKDGSWQTETPTHKDDGKNPEGKVHHLSDVARRKMIKMNANNEEVELDEVLDTRKSIKSYLDKNDAQRTTLKASGTFDKVKKRLTGANKALDKLSKLNREEVESLDEIEYNGYGKEVKTPKMVGMHFYNVPKEKEADAKRWGLKQTKSGKWGKTKYDTSGASHNDDVRRTDMQFGKSTYWEPKKVSESIEFLELDEMNIGKKQPRPDTHHIVDKENKPLSLAAYYDKTKAEKDRDEKHPGSKVITRGPRGKVKEEVELEEKLNIQNTSMGDIIKDFQTSDAPQFAGKSQAKRRQMAIAAKMAAEEYLNEENAVDKVTMDVPLLIRIMEYSKEDAKSDMDLHKVAENLVEYSKSGKTLTMACYNHVVGINEAKRPEDDSVPFITNEDDLAGHVDKIKKTVKHHFKKLKANEEVESLDELSKRTLGSYIKKATNSNDKRSISNLSSLAASKIDNDVGDDGEAEDRKSYKRSASISKAVDKLTKESYVEESGQTERKKSFVDMLDRISAKAKENTKLQQNRKIEPKLPKKELDEAKKDSYQIYHPTYSSAVQHAEKHLNKQGFDIHPDDWFHHVNAGPSKPAEGKTVSLHIPLHKDGVPSKKVAHIQVYNRGNDLANNHELNMYHN